MYCYVMQPWITVRGQSTITSITQTESCWLDLTAFQDIVTWLDCREVSAGGGTDVQIAYQTSPTKDDSLFVPIVTAANVGTGVATTTMLNTGVTNPLARWLRWQLTVTGSPSSAWDATFRVFIAANIVGRGRAKASSALKAVRAPTRSGPAGTASTVPSTPLHQQTGGGTTYGTMVPGTASRGTATPVTYGTAVPMSGPPMAIQAKR